ncbi:MAG: hypothetical protein L7S65_06230 [Schleiferiaceae bacterium]|nr:hypothetical protein [Schleiferiaceae bacterium]
MFSKVYFLRLWVPYAVITLFTTLLTVYCIQPQLGIEVASGWVLVRNIVFMWGAKTGLAVFLYLYWYWEWPTLAKHIIALSLSWGMVLGLGLMGTQIPG